MYLGQQTWRLVSVQVSDQMDAEVQFNEAEVSHVVAQPHLNFSLLRWSDVALFSLI